LAFPLALVYGCKTVAVSSLSSETPATGGVGVHDESAAFRDVLLGCLDAPATDAQTRHLLYLPTAAMLSAPAAAKPEDFLTQLAAAYREQTPAELVTHSAEVPTKALATATIDARLAKAVPLVIVVPGVFGEFIKTRAFEEVFANEASSFHRTWLNAVQSSQDPALTQDTYFSLDANSNVTAKLLDLMSVASIDDADGHPLVNALLFNTPRFSLESLGTSPSISAIFSRRLSKFFALMGVPSRIVFVGYSRGTSVALDMLAEASTRQDAWVTHVGTMVSLGGVVFGSDLADQANVPGSDTNREIVLVRALHDELQVPGDDASLFGTMHIAAENTAAWAAFVAQLALINPSFTPASLARMAYYSDVTSSLGIIMQFWQDLGLTSFVTGYSANIVKFKKLVQAVLEGVDDLTTPTRLAWWRSHALPTNVRYLTLAATMSDPAAKGEADLVNSPVGFNPTAVDDQLLRNNYASFKAATGFALNDSQMALHKTIFWPGLIASLSPGGAHLDTGFLGIAGTHHWGLALRIVNENADGSVNPFPRAALLKALAYTSLGNTK